MDTYIVSTARKDHSGKIVEFRWVKVDGHMQAIGASEVVSFDDVCDALARGDEVFARDKLGGNGGRVFLGVNSSGETIIELEANVSELEQIGDLPRF
ncbi:hypothetical protein HK44_008000 [Pseudomonas fluorescens HK44]|uniref:DUF3892 domain-containing protein n=1 Tax=Pseudomonas fluorescens HK44 TaxID=1042209 RepID=A0A010RZI5_PSEFL|nr:hypothetical protein [Pseudomonas fluorescens]EXF94134.1 hypothetical protein HK44_008000 [Pseudomonas fluorescens HK44]